MITEAGLNELVTAIHAQDASSGCMVGFMGGNGVSRLLHSGFSDRQGYGTVIIIEELIYGRSLYIPLPFPPQRIMEMEALPTPVTQRSVVLNNDPSRREGTGALLSCGLTIASIGVIYLSGTASGPVGWASLAAFIATPAGIGLVAGALQCFNGAYRWSESDSNSQSNSLQQLDENPDGTPSNYTVFWNVTDAIGVATGLLSLGQAARPVLSLLRQRWALNGGSLTAIKEAVLRAISTPEGRRELETALRQVGNFSQRGAATAIARTTTDVAQRAARSERIMRSVHSILLRRTQEIVTRDFTLAIINDAAGLALSASPQSGTFGTGSGSGALSTTWGCATAQNATGFGQCMGENFIPHQSNTSASVTVPTTRPPIPDRLHSSMLYHFVDL